MLLRKAKTATGRIIQGIGIALWIAAGVITFIWTLYVLFKVFGAWAIFVGFFVAPVTYVASIFIVWFSTGIFPLALLIPYVASWVGMALLAAGGVITGQD